ncbi:hypothetical protein QE152_g11037 [Popillia japonica]|uniref:Uncharacterized protein n=1 Tax=Popillia japonica TaxID=7064 RepID=A0AAW1LRE8_POPJA
MLWLGVPKKLVKLTKMSLLGTRSEVLCKGYRSEMFPVKTGPRQGNPLINDLTQSGTRDSDKEKWHKSKWVNF